jgi:hypothetical protein
VSEWAEREIVFNEPDCHGPFSLAGREYLREPLDNWGRQEVTDQVTVMAPRTGKTRILYAGLAWTIKHAPARILYVKPKTKGTAGAEDDARTRCIPMIRASKALAALIPGGGNRRHEFKTPQQILGGAIIDWTGSNSVAALASNPCRVVIQDEVEKFNSARKRDEDGQVVEADASALADERCKEFSNPKRFKASTPTLVSGRIWQELTTKSDFRRRHMPCPHCSKLVVLAWSKDFSMLPKLGCEAYVVWDKAAKLENGTWNEDLVRETAHYECAHCKGKITDNHKPAMDRAGQWIPTFPDRSHRGYHLPAMNAMHTQCGVGEMAVRFLKAIHSLDGPRSFVNNDLAEPYGSQDASGKRVEKALAIQVGAEWKKIMTVDVQQTGPEVRWNGEVVVAYFWFVVRAYSGDKIIGIDGGPLETWEDVASAQKKHTVPDVGVIVDSGFGSKDNAGVYRECAAHGDVDRDNQTQINWHMGWMPAKGMPGHRTWPDPDTKARAHYNLATIDPYEGTQDAGQIQMSLFQFPRDYFLNQLDRLRYGKVAGVTWGIGPALDQDLYHVHMRGKVKKTVIKMGQEVVAWVPRHRHAPDHLQSCETMQVAAANYYGFLNTHPKDETE